MAMLVRMLQRSTTQLQKFIWNYDKKKLNREKNSAWVQSQDGRVITIMEKNSILLAKNKFTQIATYATYTELTVQSEDRKKEAHCSESISIQKAMN